MTITLHLQTLTQKTMILNLAPKETCKLKKR